METKYSPEEKRIIKALHLIPSGEDGHKECVSCWCEPVCISKEPDGGFEVWRHK